MNYELDYVCPSIDSTQLESNPHSLLLDYVVDVLLICEVSAAPVGVVVVTVMWQHATSPQHYSEKHVPLRVMIYSYFT